jgi:hydroxymethylbilane synthase
LELRLRGAAISPDGQRAVRSSGTGALIDAAAVGSRLAAELLAEGAAHVLGEHA